MRLSTLFAFVLPSLLCSATATEEVEELIFVPRHEWDHGLQKRQSVPNAEAPANVTLQDHEQLLWTTPPSESTLEHEVIH